MFKICLDPDPRYHQGSGSTTITSTLLLTWTVLVASSVMVLSADIAELTTDAAAELATDSNDAVATDRAELATDGGGRDSCEWADISAVFVGTVADADTVLCDVTAEVDPVVKAGDDDDVGSVDASSLVEGLRLLSFARL